MIDNDPFTWILAPAVLIGIVWPRLSFFYKTWIGVAIKEHRTRRYPSTFNWDQTSADLLTPELREFLGRAVLGFRNAGYEVLANLRRVDEPAGEKLKTNHWVVPMLDPKTSDRAWIAMTTGESVRFLSFGVFSEFVDEFYLTTSNRPLAGLSPADPETHPAAFVWVMDPVMLIEAHRRRIAQFGRAESPRKALPPGGVIEELNESWKRELNWMVHSGYYFRPSTGDCIRKTWRGAFLSNWRMQPIIKRRLLSRRDAKARQLWKQLGMDQWAPEQPIEPSIAESAQNEPVEAQDGLLPAEEPPASLIYQSELAPGQIRREKSEGTLTIRVMLRTAGKILELGSIHVAAAVFMAILIAWSIASTWSIRHATLSIPLQFRPSYFRANMLVWSAFLIYECVQIARALSRRARGTTIISASHQGIRFSNGPGAVRNGHFSRSQIEALLVTRDQIGFGRPVFRLQARITGHTWPLILLVSRDVKRLVTLRQELLEALGIIERHAQP